jgi:hypothetical protein
MKLGFLAHRSTSGLILDSPRENHIFKGGSHVYNVKGEIPIFRYLKPYHNLETRVFHPNLKQLTNVSILFLEFNMILRGKHLLTIQQ